ncbi:hypothetical protein JNO54_08065 [Janibacter sp. YIM B02568]|uniref:DUF6318 family protein n=1 Tax=Janibacter endophyticus TaxID=2806261 RepID=UPI0019525872|nr:DUF6318 family protein [Janibacter endophyticus]MBM6546094.1 hypothetical protein [Janibacter endophyticus]
MRLRRLTAALALSALALSGCSGDTNGDGTSTTSSVKPTVIDPTGSSSPTSESPTSSSASSTTEAAPDGPPEEARANTKEGAEAFAKWYAVEMGDATTDGDTSTLRSHTSIDCKVCLRYLELTEETAARYGHVRSNPHQVGVERSSQDEEGVWRVKTRIDHDKIEYRKGGKVRSFVDPGGFDLNLELNRLNGGWETQDWLLVQ